MVIVSKNTKKLSYDITPNLISFVSIMTIRSIIHFK